MKIRNKHGVALVVSLFVIVILISVASIFVVRAVTENNAVKKELNSGKAFYVAEAGAQLGLDGINTLINDNLRDTISSANPNVVGNKAESYVSSGDGLGFLEEYVKDGGTSQIVITGQQADFSGGVTQLGDGSYDFDIAITEKDNPVSVGVDAWDFTYNYEVTSSGSFSGSSRNIMINGDFTVRVQKDNFAKYALFTDHHGMPSGSTVWFTNSTDFEGPIHTNERFSFAYNPGGTFDGAVTQQNSRARFYNNGRSILSNSDANGVIDVPTFSDSFSRGESQIVLPSAVQKNDLADQAKGGQNLLGNGIFLANDGSNVVGGIFTRGDTDIEMSVDGSGNAVYTLTEGGTTKTVTVDIDNDQTTLSQGGLPDQVYSGVPSGTDNVGTIIYVDGEVSNLSGTVQKDTELTVSSENDIVIADNVLYEDYTAAVGNPGDPGYVAPNATGTENLLGILSWGGDVRIGATAPDDVNIHGIILARGGMFTVDSYDNWGVGERGITTLLGGVITDFYGAFGQFNGRTGEMGAGYGRNFIYDNRTLQGKSPPYFPTLNVFIAFTDDISDNLVWQEK